MEWRLRPPTALSFRCLWLQGPHGREETCRPTHCFRCFSLKGTRLPSTHSPLATLRRNHKPPLPICGGPEKAREPWVSREQSVCLCTCLSWLPFVLSVKCAPACPGFPHSPLYRPCSAGMREFRHQSRLPHAYRLAFAHAVPLTLLLPTRLLVARSYLLSMLHLGFYFLSPPGGLGHLLWPPYLPAWMSLVPHCPAIYFPVFSTFSLHQPEL